jgi:asparagine synthase (glutamine-hydrolysing)
MCGIAGYVVRGGAAERSTVQGMCDQIRHRGPDDEGIHLDGACGLGMRRLSIIDLDTGHQPMSNEDGAVWVVFNGEIYNFQELRRELIGRGHGFSTNSDTETLVHLYEQEGRRGIARLRGMFAYAIWDSRNRTLLLARDRLGKKPLYYAVLPEGLYFASEIKSLRAAGVPLDIDEQALRLYLHLGYVPDPWSIFRAIRKLPPGGWLTYGQDGRLEQGRYWEVPPPCEEPAAGFTEEAACEEIRRVFDESVRLRMISDVPLGAFLSGGIDSSLVVASMARQSSQRVKTFSIGFEETEYNELPYARVLAGRYNTEHRELVVRPDSVSLVPKLIASFDEPFADSSAIPVYLVSQFAAEHVKVVLTGDGGDEFFAGYTSFFDVERFRWTEGIPQTARRALSGIAELLPYQAYGKNYLRAISRPSALDRYIEFGTTGSFLRRRVLQPYWILPWDAAFFRETFGAAILPDTADCLSQAMHFEATTKLAGDILVKVDRMSMAQSLEVRCPLLDHELVELACRIPNRWKIRGGQGKLILLKALGDRLPPELLDRPKRGFGIPLRNWFRGPLRSLVWDHLTGAGFLNRGIVSGRFVRRALEEHAAARRDNSFLIWQLLVLAIWLEIHEAAHGLPSAVGALG